MVSHDRTRSVGDDSTSHGHVSSGGSRDTQLLFAEQDQEAMLDGVVAAFAPRVVSRDERIA